VRPPRECPSERLGARLKLCMLVNLLLFILIVLSLFRIQVLDHSRWSALADGQNTVELEIEPGRGRIYDRNGYLVAGNESFARFSVYWPEVPADQASEVDRVAGLLSGAGFPVPLDRKPGYQVLADDVPYPVALEIMSQGSRLVNCAVLNRRVYPMGDVMMPVIGRCTPDNTEGLELQLNSVLQGVPGRTTLERSAWMGYSLQDIESESVPARDGLDVILTIDARFQAIAQEELEAAVIQAGAEWGAVVVVDPGNGDILAMASYPVRDENGAPARNNCVQSNHEPGSTFKAFTLAAGLSEGLVSLSDSFDVSRGWMEVSGVRIHDSHHIDSVLSLTQVISLSSNVGTVMMARAIPDSILYNYCRDFGFGRATGVELPGELDGVLYPPSRWSGVSRANLAIGQEICVTPLQLAMAYSAIANGGILYGPRLVSATGSDGEWSHWNVFERGRVISPETAAQIRSILTTAVEEGTGTSAMIPGVRIAGKTGTAERLALGDNMYLSAFAGMVPAENPEIVAVVVIDQPSYAYRWGSTLAAPAFQRIVSRMLSSDPDMALSPQGSGEGMLASGWEAAR